VWGESTHLEHSRVTVTLPVVLHSFHDWTVKLQWNLFPGGRVFIWKISARPIPSTVYIPLPSIQMYSEIPEASYFQTLAGVQGRVCPRACMTSMQVFESWILMHVFELDSTWKFPLQISLLEVCLFQGLWLSGKRGADLANVNPKGEMSVVWLTEWLLTLGAQDGSTLSFHQLGLQIIKPVLSETSPRLILFPGIRWALHKCKTVWVYITWGQVRRVQSIQTFKSGAQQLCLLQQTADGHFHTPLHVWTSEVHSWSLGIKNNKFSKNIMVAFFFQALYCLPPLLTGFIRSGRTRKPEYPTIHENSSMRMPSREVRTRVSKYSIHRTLQRRDVNGQFPPSAHMRRGHSLLCFHRAVFDSTVHNSRYSGSKFGPKTIISCYSYQQIVLRMILVVENVFNSCSTAG
jgi:hypothetical protein